MNKKKNQLNKNGDKMSFDIPLDSQGERALVTMVRGEERREGGRREMPEGKVWMP